MEWFWYETVTREMIIYIQSLKIWNQSMFLKYWAWHRHIFCTRAHRVEVKVTVKDVVTEGRKLFQSAQRTLHYSIHLSNWDWRVELFLWDKTWLFLSSKWWHPLICIRRAYYQILDPSIQNANYYYILSVLIVIINTSC